MSKPQPLRSFFLILLLACPLAAIADDARLLKNERIGPLKLGTSAKQVLSLIQPKPQRGPIDKWDADNDYHQEWNFRKRGIKLGMSSSKRGGAQFIESIAISPPCAFSTQRGIHIGSAEGKVLQAYKNVLNREESVSGSSLVAGSYYGGLVFGIKNGKVTDIFLGAAAE